MNNNPITVDRITVISGEIINDIKKLAPQIGHNYKPLTDQDIAEIISSPNTFLFAARDSNTQKIIGMITLLIYRIPYVKKSSIEDLVVDQDNRGRGAGKMLMDKAIDFAREKGAAYVDLTARPRREDSNSLYKKMGFIKRNTNVYRKIFSYDEV